MHDSIMRSMTEIESELNISILLKAALELPYKKDSTGVLLAYGRGAKADVLPFPLIIATWEIEEFRKQKPLWVMVNVIPPGVEVPIHVDPLPPTEAQGELPHVERWHLPLKCNKSAHFWTIDHGDYIPQEGVWFGPVKYWRPHSVGNDLCRNSTSDPYPKDRVHLVVDLDTKVRID